LPGAIHGKVVKDSEQHDLELTVRLYEPNAVITVTLDEQPLYEWSGAITALKSNPVWKGESGAFTLGSQNPNWVVYAVKVKRN
jgi:hypothetical protein